MGLVADAAVCYHCGEKCGNHKLDINEKSFCCAGCRSVFLLLHQNDLTDYYCLNEVPGVRVSDSQPEKFSFLDDAGIAGKLLSFSDARQSQVTFHLPQMHCSSCLWLLEHLGRLNAFIINSRVNFAAKEVYISFDHKGITLRQLAELLANIGYEPYITLAENGPAGPKPGTLPFRKNAYILGITGFCFANIMLISFPEYLGMNAIEDHKLIQFFRAINLLLSLPVLLYGAREFFANSIYSFKQRYVNIDTPIALAILVTFIRSVYEIVSGTGAGYLDSMSGIVFFMLLGRTLQNRSYSTLSFNRDFRSYFPIAVTSKREDGESIIPLQDIKEHDVLKLHHLEVVPTDCILSKGKAIIDYSFVTGENIPEHILPGALIYAGGKVTGSAIEVVAIKDFKQNSFTRLWNNDAFKKTESDRDAMVTIISKYFSAAVLLIALSAFIVWQFINPGNSWNALTAVLIVACPCALLLNATFVNGYLLEFFAGKGFFLKNAGVIEQLAHIDHIAFDKTGTITEASASSVNIRQMNMNDNELRLFLSVIGQSMHPLSRAIAGLYNRIYQPVFASVKEEPGKGIEAWIEDHYFKIGSRKFVSGAIGSDPEMSEVYVSVDSEIKAIYRFRNCIKHGVAELISKLNSYSLSVISGDNESSSTQMKKLFPEKTVLRYRHTPQQKLEYIAGLQREGQKVMMVGDGLNDAGALQQSDAGIAVVQHSFSFSPACDAMLQTDKISSLPDFMSIARRGQRLIIVGFLYSLLFNIAGISFAVTANMSPMVAAILMPSSSLGIMLIAYLGVRLIVKKGSAGL
jgi:P-type Cu+ transporter